MDTSFVEHEVLLSGPEAPRIACPATCMPAPPLRQCALSPIDLCRGVSLQIHMSDIAIFNFLCGRGVIPGKSVLIIESNQQGSSSAGMNKPCLWETSGHQVIIRILVKL